MQTNSRWDNDLGYMLDFQNFAKMQKDITEEVLSNDKYINVKLNKWKYFNNLMDVQDGSHKPNMQDNLYHSQPPSLAISKPHACSFLSG